MSSPGLGRRFVTVWAGQTLSSIGSALSGVGVAVYVFVETGSAAWLGLLAALASVPFVLTTPFLTITDRFARRTVMIAGDTFAVTGPAVALGLALAGRLEIWHLAVAGLLGGVGTAFQWPASQAAVPALVEPDAIPRANSLNQLGPALGIVLGPVLATPLVAWWGIEAVLLADIATFVVAVVATTSVRFDDATDDSAVVDDGSWASALAWLREDGRPLVTLLGVMATVNFFMAFFNVSVLVLATDLGGTARAGLVMGAVGASMILGSLVSARRGISDDRIKTVSSGLAAAGGGLVIAALRPSFTLVIVGVVLGLASVPWLQAAVSTIFHEQVPASMHGRVFGLRTSLGRSLEPIGAITGGLLVAHVATPAMRADGSLGGSVGRVLGTGDGRGAALVLALVGVILVIIGARLSMSPIRERLRRAEPVLHSTTEQPTIDSLAI